MSYADLLTHTLTIERFTVGPATEANYYQPTQTWAAVATVRGLVQPIRSRFVAERPAATEAGAVVTDHFIFTELNSGLTEADRVVYATEVYQIETLERRQYGTQGHLQATARRVTP